ncbi:hypothetical protein HYV70_05455 [Candidatus Uhrbacteria bacterium]|nr:hypothetical protein [Candidatus Uhrbacteria bacterium]
MKGEKPICSHCGYPKHTNVHAPDCPTKTHVVKEIIELTQHDMMFEDEVHDFFDPRMNHAKQDGEKGEMTANRYRRLRNELTLLADTETLQSISLARVSEAMTETLGVMVTLGSEYTDHLETESKKEQMERDRVAKKAETVFRQSCEKIYDNVRVSLDRISTELQIITNKLKRTESPVLGTIRETIKVHMELIQEQGGASTLKETDPYKLMLLLNSTLSEYGTILQNDGWITEEARLNGNIETNALQTFKKDLVFANEALYRVMLLVDQLKQKMDKTRIEPVKKDRSDTKTETSSDQKEKEAERKKKFSEALERLLKEEDEAISLAIDRQANLVREFGVYIDAFASYYPDEKRADAIRNILEELQHHIQQDTSEDKPFIKRLKAERAFMATLAEKRPDIIEAFKKAKERERERQLLATQLFLTYDGTTLFFLVSPQGMLGHLFEYMENNKAI